MPSPRPPQPTRTTSLGFAVLAAQVAAGATEVQLLPAGEFRAVDGSGRPDDIEGGKPWRIDAAVAALVMARASVLTNPFVIDYEHQTLKAAENGRPAPAAGRWKAMEWREGVGLFATDVQWTERAAALIAAREYLYISAVFYYDLKTGDVLAMRMAALTNTPGLDGMQPLAALTAQMAAGWIDPCGSQQAAESPEDDSEESLMNELLKKLLAALGLPEATTAEAALTAVTALKTQATTDGQALAALKAAQPAGGAVDLTQYVPVATYNAVTAQMAALTAQASGGVDALIETARSEGRVFPGEESYLKQLGATAGVAVLTAQLKARPVIPALAGMQSAALTAQHQAGPGVAGAAGAAGAAAGGLDAAGLAVCTQLGLSPEQYLAAQVKK